MPYADWKAPDGDGEVLLWPAAGELLAQTRENHRRLGAAHGVRIQNIPLPELRTLLRKTIGHVDDDAPLIATGHQAELIHTGVWAKIALINAVARRLGGTAHHFAVDTDAPKHLELKWPGAAWAITDDQRLGSAAWCGLLEGPTPAYLGKVTHELQEAAAGWDFKPLAGSFLAAMRRPTADRAELSWELTHAMHEVDGDLGLEHRVGQVSGLLRSAPYLIFAHHLMARAGEFAADYNTCLAEYRLAAGIRSATRPMPDLALRDTECEAAFWLDELNDGRRTRATVAACDGGWRLSINGDDFIFERGADGRAAGAALAAFLGRRQLRLSPRALTLTMFLRLFVADQFVHGIGGGRYDQICDRLMQRHLGLEAPAFAVTTATLYFPGAAGVRRLDAGSLLQEGRRLRHGLGNPRKEAMVRRIAAMPRHAPQRRELFYEMHAMLARQPNRAQSRQWEERLRQDRRQQDAMFDRELFYALQPAERLQGIIQGYEDRLK